MYVNILSTYFHKFNTKPNTINRIALIAGTPNNIGKFFVNVMHKSNMKYYYIRRYILNCRKRNNHIYTRYETQQ